MKTLPLGQLLSMPNMPNKVTARVREKRKNSCQPFYFLIECLLKKFSLFASFSLHCFFYSLSLSPGLISSSRRMGYPRRIRRIGFRMRNCPSSSFLLERPSGSSFDSYQGEGRNGKPSVLLFIWQERKLENKQKKSHRFESTREKELRQI